MRDPDPIDRDGPEIIEGLAHLLELIEERYRTGDLLLDGENSQTVVDWAGLRWKARERLRDLVADEGPEGAAEILADEHPDWPPERVSALSMGAEPTPAELLRRAELLLPDDEEGRFLVEARILPLLADKRVICWVLVHEAGILLDREYRVTGPYRTEADAERAMRERFPDETDA